jgi:hypothetical protein
LEGAPDGFSLGDLGSQSPALFYEKASGPGGCVHYFPPFIHPDNESIQAMK